MLPTRTATQPKFSRGLIAETGVIPAGYQLIRDTFPFQVVDKKTVVEDINGSPQPVTRVTGLFQMGDKENANGRYYPTNDVLIPAVRQIQEDIGARAVMGEYDHPCWGSSDFRVLTVDGWKEFADIKVGDYVWSRVDGVSKPSRVNAIVDEPYDGMAYHFKNKFIDAIATPGHRFLLDTRSDGGHRPHQTYRTAEDIFVSGNAYRHERIPRTAKWQQVQTPTFTLPSGLELDAKDFCAFLGIYLAEGFVKTKWTINICQRSQYGIDAISELLQRLPFKWHRIDKGFAVVSKDLVAYLKPLGDKYTKRVPVEIKRLDADCLNMLVNWYCIGDGRLVKSRPSRPLQESWNYDPDTSLAGCGTATVSRPYVRAEVFTVSKQLLYDLHECLVLSGGCGTVSIIKPKDRLIKGRCILAVNSQPLYQLHVAKFKNITLDRRMLSIEQVHHIGRIYCLSVDHGNFYMEHKGHSFWTGNSDAKIHLDRCSHLITKLWMEGKKVYGQAEVLHLLPCGAMLRGLFEHKVRVGISSRGVGDMEVQEQNGHETYRVMPGYAFVTFDAVAEPSVGGAILNITEGLNKRLTPLRQQKARFSPQTYQNMLVAEIDKFFDL